VSRATGNLKEAVRQLADVRGIALWVSNHIIVKPEANKLGYVDAAEIDSRISVLPGEICQCCASPVG
jgi:hypothetical protein